MIDKKWNKSNIAEACLRSYSNWQRGRKQNMAILR
jgi:hypothetical protein